jgi:TP901 family phage tail tape measure protein
MASGGRIKGITVEIGGDTGPLSAALKGVNGTIRETGSQLKDINRLLKLDPTNVTLLGQKAGAAQKELLALQEKEKTLKAADGDLKKQLSEGKISTEQYQAYQRELIATQEKIKGLKKESTTVGNVLGAFGEEAKGAGEKISGAGQKMLPATLAIGAVGGAAVKTASDFETSMSQTAGALNVPMSKMGSLRDLAMKMGADTQFSATEAGNAMTELAKGGLTEADIKGGALKATMDLAASSGMELGDAANTVVQAMGGFGLSANNSAQAVNALAGAAAASSTDVAPLADALSQCAAQAHTAGWSIQDTTAVLGAFADAGITGSDAGTSLKTMLQRLGAPTDKAADAMKKYGIDVWDSNGHMKDAAGISQELQNKMGGLSDQQKQQALSTIFGSDATRAATVLMSEGSKGLSKYTKATNDQEAAQRLANSQMGPTEKAMEQMKGSIETAGIAIGTALLPMIQKLSGFIQNLANWFSNLSPGMQNVVLIIGGIVAAVGPLLIILGTLISSIGTIAAFLGGPVMAAILPILPIIAAVVAAIIIVIAIVKNWGAISQWFGNLWAAVCGGLQTAWQAVVGFFSSIPGWWDGLWTQVGQFFSNCWNGIISFFTSTIPTWIAAIGDWFAKIPYNLGLALGTAVRAVINFGKNVWNWVTGELPKIIQGIIDWFAKLPGRIWNFLVQTVTNIGKWGSNMWSYLSVQIPKIINGIGNWFSQLPGRIWNFLVNVVRNVSSWGSSMWSTATSAASNVVQGVVSFFSDLPGNMLNIGRNVIYGIWDGITGAAGWLWSKVSGFCNNFIAGFKKGLGIHSPSTLFADVIGKNAVLGIGKGFTDNLDSVVGKMSAAVQKLVPEMNLGVNANLQSAAVPTVPTQKIVLESHIDMDGRELALAASPYLSKQLGFDNG